MGAVHARGGRCPVPPALYADWVESLLKVVAETDPEADAALMARWREAMGVVVETFKARDGAAEPAPEARGEGARGLFSRVMQGLRPQPA